MICKYKKIQAIQISPEITEMIEIADKDFTTTIINVLSNLKKKQIIRKNGNYTK